MTLAPAPGTAGQSTHARLGETQISEWCILLPCLLHIDPVHQAPVTKVVPGSGIGRSCAFRSYRVKSMTNAGPPAFQSLTSAMRKSLFMNQRISRLASDPPIPYPTRSQYHGQVRGFSWSLPPVLGRDRLSSFYGSCQRGNEFPRFPGQRTKELAE